MQMSSSAVLHSNEYALSSLHESPTVNSFSLSFSSLSSPKFLSIPLCLFQHWTYSVISKGPGSPSTFWFLISFSIFYSPDTSSYQLLSCLRLSPHHLLLAILFYLLTLLSLPLMVPIMYSSTVRQRCTIRK